MATTPSFKERFLNIAAHVLNGDFNKQNSGELDEQALRDQVFRWANYADHAPRGLFEPVASRVVVLGHSRQRASPTDDAGRRALVTGDDPTDVTNVPGSLTTLSTEVAAPSPPTREAPLKAPRAGRQRKPAQE